MTCSSIRDFVDYMVDFYQQSDRRKIVSTIDTYGDEELDPNKLQGLRDREPAFDPLGVKPKLFSDMYLFDLFLNDQLARSQMNAELTHVVGDGEQSGTKSLKTPQATTLPPRYIRKEGREETRRKNPISNDTRVGVASETLPVLPPYVHSWNAPSQVTPGYFTLIENMRSVTQVPHTRAWLCLDRALFDSHFKINITSQLARMNGGGGVPDGRGGSFEPFAGAHFQGDCKAKMMQLLYVDVMRAIEETPDV